MGLVKVKWPREEGWALANEEDVGTLYELYEEPKPATTTKTKTTTAVLPAL